MTDQEKNEVLAKFARFTYWDDDDPQNQSRSGRVGWYAPDSGTLASAVTLPDLLHSLDAQAKWLWPIAVTRGWFDKVLLALVDAAYDRDPVAPACAEALLEHRDEDWRAPMEVKP